MLVLVKNMVCNRCILTIQNILKDTDIQNAFVSIGEINFEKAPGQKKMEQLSSKLLEVGFEIINNQQSALIEKIKQLVIKKARNEVDKLEIKWKLSTFITHYISNEYTYLSSLFSEVEGRTIENYYIEQRIEKVKELMVYNQLTLSQIADELDYSSVAHLSAQFKKVTGLTPSHFKTIGDKKRKPLDEV